MPRIVKRKKNINEGIDIDPKTMTVSYNPNHEDNVDTSLDNNPTVDKEIIDGIEVWSIFKRKRGYYGDGNPLVYALKGENWKFKSKKDKIAIDNQFDMIASKFVDEHPFDVTIIIPSTNKLNYHIAGTIMAKCISAELINGVICKITTTDVHDIVLDFKSKFRTYYKNEFNAAYYELCRYLDRMDTECDGYFVRHYIKNSNMRNTIDVTLKRSDDISAEFANKINDRNVLIIDDTISRGQTIKEACDIIKQSYSPKSITVLTLLSNLKEE